MNDSEAQVQEKAQPIKLTRRYYRFEIDDLMKNNDKITSDFVVLLRRIVGAHVDCTAEPEATPQLIELAKLNKQYLQAGIELGGETYGIMVYIPNLVCKKERKPLFCLIPQFPEGRLRYLDDI